MTTVHSMAYPETPTSTQSGFVEVRQQVDVSSCYPSPKLTASVNEVVLGIDENTPMDLLANVIKVLKNA